VAPRFFDQLDYFLRIRLLVRMIIYGDIGALACVGNRGRAAHTAVAAGYQRLAAGEAPAPLIGGLAVIRLRLHLASKTRPGLRLTLERWLRIFTGRILHALSHCLSSCSRGGLGKSWRDDHAGQPGTERSDNLAAGEKIQFVCEAVPAELLERRH